MAGGLFGRPLVFNMKCIVFSLICMALFLYNPEFKNDYYMYLTLFSIFIIAYVAMAWYDYFYNCDIAPLKRGEKGITRLMKPDAQQECDNKEDISARRIIIYLSHLLFIVPLLVYISINKDKINPIVYPLLGVLAVFTAGYHGSYLMTSFH